MLRATQGRNGRGPKGLYEGHSCTCPELPCHGIAHLVYLTQVHDQVKASPPGLATNPTARHESMPRFVSTLSSLYTTVTHLPKQQMVFRVRSVGRSVRLGPAKSQFGLPLFCPRLNIPHASRQLCLLFIFRYSTILDNIVFTDSQKNKETL